MVFLEHREGDGHWQDTRGQEGLVITWSQSVTECLVYGGGLGARLRAWMTSKGQLSNRKVCDWICNSSGRWWWCIAWERLEAGRPGRRLLQGSGRKATEGLTRGQGQRGREWM